jgi:hypothetical protein
MDFLATAPGTDTYIMECEPGVDTNLLLNNDPFTQSVDGWSIVNNCTSGGSVGRADHRISPSYFKSHVAGYEYMWMAKEGRKEI